MREPLGAVVEAVNVWASPLTFKPHRVVLSWPGMTGASTLGRFRSTRPRASPVDS